MSPHTLHRSTIPPVSMKEAYIHQHWEIQYKKCWQVNAEENRKDIEGVLTGECASEATRSLGHCGMIVGCRWYRRYLRNGSIVYFRKLEDHSRGRSSSPLFPSLLQGPNLLKGDTLWGWRLRVGGGRLGLVSTWRAARTRAGTAGRTSIQDDTTWRNIEGQKKKTEFTELHLGRCSRAQCEWEWKCWAMLYFDSMSLLGRFPQPHTKPCPCCDNKKFESLIC